MSRTEVTLVLSGGGAKTAAHVGAARALAEAGCVPSRYVATSMGAVLAAALAVGVDPGTLLERLPEIGRRGIVRDPLAPVQGLFLRSLLKPGPFRRAVEELVPARRFTDLRVPLTVCVTDLDTGELLLYGAGGMDAPLVEVLLASCALPIYFPAHPLEGRRCGDGGLHGALPLAPAGRLAREPVVAVDVGPGFDLGEPGAPVSVPAVIRAHEEALGTLMAQATAAQLALWQADQARPELVYVRPRVERSATFRVDRVHRYAEEGYLAAREALLRWRART
ncbi:MAG TPA: patatin-like phospholipase family protein [Gemmatimonadales bacterium]